MISCARIKKGPRGAPARVSRRGDRYLVHMRMRTVFEKHESKTFVFCIDIEMPKGCYCFVQCPTTFKEELPSILPVSESIEGRGEAAPLMLTMKNRTEEKQEWVFDAPIASLYFMDAFPVHVENSAD